MNTITPETPSEHPSPFRKAIIDDDLATAKCLIKMVLLSAGWMKRD